MRCVRVAPEEDDQRGGHDAEDDDAQAEGQAVAAEGELAGHEAVLGQDGGQAREGVEGGVGGQEEDERRERLEEVEADRVAAEDGRGDLGDDRLRRVRGRVVDGHDAEASRPRR